MTALGNRRCGVLLVPATINLNLVMLARWLYPKPQDMETSPPAIAASQPPRVFWIYMLGAILVAAGFADYPLIAFHFGRTATVPGDWIAIFYSVAMAVSGTGSLVLGRLFDRLGFAVLVVLTLLSALFAPLVFLGGFWAALIGAAIWASEWAFTNPSFLRQLPRWCPSSAEPGPSAYSPPGMAYSGLSEVRQLESSTICRCRP